MRILLSTTSFQDTPGRHHDILEKSGFEIVRARHPFKIHAKTGVKRDGIAAKVAQTYPGWTVDPETERARVSLLDVIAAADERGLAMVFTAIESARTGQRIPIFV